VEIVNCKFNVLEWTENRASGNIIKEVKCYGHQMYVKNESLSVMSTAVEMPRRRMWHDFGAFLNQWLEW